MPFSSYLDRLITALSLIDERQIDAVAELLTYTKVFTVGNGGSATTASHFACDLNKNSGGAAVAFSLSDGPLLTAVANDIDYAKAFRWQIEKFAGRGDVLAAFSVSGSSLNVVEALFAAKSRGLSTVALLGCDGGDALQYADAAVIVPSRDYGIVEDAHLAVSHMVTEKLRGKPLLA